MSEFSDEPCLDRQRLLSQDEKDAYPAEHDFGKSRSKAKIYLLLFYISVLVNAILIAGAPIWILFSRNPNQHSPAEAAIEYKTIVFRSGLHGDITEYQGPEDEVNARWEELYNDTPVSAISQELADKLPNRTTALPFDHTKYPIQLDVFHQLHCLNKLRKLLYPLKYGPTSSEDGESTTAHLSHCVESLRQALQCASDVSTLFWEWSPQRGRMMGNTRTTHTCRDFEAVRRWAGDRRVGREWDLGVYVEGAPVWGNE